MFEQTKTLEEIKAGDLGSFTGRFGGSKHSKDCAELCSMRKLEFAVEQFKRIENYEPWGDDHADNLHLTLKLIKETRYEFEEMIKILEK